MSNVTPINPARPVKKGEPEPRLYAMFGADANGFFTTHALVPPIEGVEPHAAFLALMEAAAASRPGRVGFAVFCGPRALGVK